MAYPTNNVHRRGRRNLGTGQTPSFPGITFTTSVGAGALTNQATLTFSNSVVASGAIGMTVPGYTAATQTQPTPTTLVISFTPGTNGTLVAKTWTAANPLPNTLSYQGGPVTSPGTNTF